MGKQSNSWVDLEFWDAHFKEQEEKHSRKNVQYMKGLKAGKNWYILKWQEAPGGEWCVKCIL